MQHSLTALKSLSTRSMSMGMSSLWMYVSINPHQSTTFGLLQSAARFESLHHAEGELCCCSGHMHCGQKSQDTVDVWEHVSRHKYKSVDHNFKLLAVWNCAQFSSPKLQYYSDVSAPLSKLLVHKCIVCIWLAMRVWKTASSTVQCRRHQRYNKQRQCQPQIEHDHYRPTLANMSRPPPARLNAISYTSLSCAINCVLTWPCTCDCDPLPPTRANAWFVYATSRTTMKSTQKKERGFV